MVCFLLVLSLEILFFVLLLRGGSVPSCLGPLFGVWYLLACCLLSAFAWLLCYAMQVVADVLSCGLATVVSAAVGAGVGQWLCVTAVLGLFGFVFGQHVLLLFTSPMVQWAVTSVSHCFYSSFVQCYCCSGPSDSLLAWKCWFWFYFAESIPFGSFFVVLQ